MSLCTLYLQFRDFNDADYELLLQLDEGVKKKTAKDFLSQIAPKVMEAKDELHKHKHSNTTNTNADSSMGSIDNLLCCICCDEFEVGCTYKLLRCQHAYHADVRVLKIFGLFQYSSFNIHSVSINGLKSRVFAQSVKPT